VEVYIILHYVCLGIFKVCIRQELVFQIFLKQITNTYS
jgi:hypothetical protein